MKNFKDTYASSKQNINLYKLIIKGVIMIDYKTDYSPLVVMKQFEQVFIK
jgi:hypothetical protein